MGIDKSKMPKMFILSPHEITLITQKYFYDGDVRSMSVDDIL